MILQEVHHLRYFYPVDSGSIITDILPEEHFQKYNKLVVWDPGRKDSSKIIKAKNLLILSVTYSEVALLLAFFNENYEYWHTRLPKFRMEDYPEIFV